AFRIGEDPSVLFPVMIHIDGFHLSHITESLYPIGHDVVKKFLPKYHHPYALDPDKPVTLGAFGPPNIYTEAKKSQEVALRASKNKILQVWQEFGNLTNRRYHPVESYNTDGADVLLLAMGSFSENAMVAIDKMRDDGQKVGLVRLRLWRPFPFQEFRQAVKDAKLLIVLDRAVSFGGPTGPVCSEIQAALYPLKTRPQVASFVGGLGGRDVSAKTFENLLKRGIQKAKEGHTDEMAMIEVRE
ncbi:MAG: pyruvate ferredoxin oxidoreductase, partial [Chloroflexi bacterium]|nr:pyruvate ferredoxin oxidoreductase [Chloroflexota bacterium]